MRFHIKGNRTKTKGIHFATADAMRFPQDGRYRKWPLFRPRRAPRSKKLAPRRVTERAMYGILPGYLERSLAH